MKHVTKQNKCFSHIAEVIRKYRAECPTGMSQSDLARALGFKNGQFISNVERGLCSMPPCKINELSRLIQAPRNEIIDAIVNDHRTTIMRSL